MLERLAARPPPRVRDRTLDAVTPDAAVAAPSPRPATVEMACWTPIEPPSAASDARGLRATLLAEPSFSGGTDGAVVHTLVLEVDAPTRTVAVDYRALDAAVLPDRGVRVRTDDDETVAVSHADVDGGTFRVRLAESRTDGALFVEYAVTRNPAGGRHTVGVVVDDERVTEARLVVVG